MKHLIFLLAFVTATVPLAQLSADGLSPHPVSRTIDRVVARVSSEPITQKEVESLRAENPGLSLPAALDALIERRLVTSWARANGIKVSQEELQKAQQSIMANNNLSESDFENLLASRGQDRRAFRDDLEEQVLVNKALGAAIGPKAMVTEEEVREKYENVYPPKPTLTIRHILISPDQASGKSDADAHDQAVRLLGEIRAGAPFETMARRFSMDNASAPRGGELGTFGPGELLPELESMALTLGPGEIGGPVRTALGYHILKLDSKGVSQPPPYSTVADEIRSSLVAQRRVELSRKWIDELRKATFIEIFPDGE